MKQNFKPLAEQVIVVTGASSGIGLATVRQAAALGASVFMIARNEDELQRIHGEHRGLGHRTAYAVADVAEVDQLQVAADACETTFGGIDTWVNNAGISLYGKLLETTEEEGRRLFDTNFWGVVNGSKVAVPYLRRRGGALVNLGSVLSEVALPVQGMYSASKFAVKGFTDALRRELLSEGAPVSVSLVIPAAVDTPYTKHARSHIGTPVHLAPVYSPEAVADAVLRCAQKNIRELPVGAAAFIFPILDRWVPRLQDRVLSIFYRPRQQSSEVSSDYRESGPGGNLFALREKDGTTRGNYPGHVMGWSLMTRIAAVKAALASGLMLSAAAVLTLKRLRG